MATIDEILDAMPEEEATTGRDYLTIDPGTRSITVPESERVFGVEGDEDAARKYFICPRYVGDGLDLAGMFLTVYWRNANGEEDGTLVNDVEIQGDYVTFSWLLPERAVAYRGALQFSVCADLPNTATKRRPDWNTTTASGEVLEGLDPDPGDVEAGTSDVVTQLRAEIVAGTAAVEAAGAAQVQNVQTEGSAQVNTVKATGAQTEADALAAIKAQGAATLATIPAEYTALTAQVDKLTRDRAAAIVCQAEGELLQITDAGNDPLQGLRIFGRTKQWKTTGKNLLDVSEENAISLAGYKNYTVSGSVVTITGLSFFGFKMPVTYGAGYTISLKKRATETTCHFRIYEYSAEPVAIAGDDPNYIGIPVNDTCAGMTSVVKNYTPTAKGVAWVVVGFYTTQVNVLTEFMAELGAEATAYEPYSGGLASPRPDWPQELQSIQGPVVRSSGTNLCNLPDMAAAGISGITWTYKDGAATANGTATAQSNVAPGKCPLNLLPGTYTVSGGKNGVFVIVTLQRGNLKEYHTSKNGLPATFETISGDVLYLYTQAPNGTTVSNVTVYPMVNAGTEALPWEPYKEPRALTITTPGSLPGIPVASGGNYTDANGKQWICDEVDLARGVYVQRVVGYEITGAESWVVSEYQPEDATAVRYDANISNVPGGSNIVDALCTHFPYNGLSGGAKREGIWVASNPKASQLNLRIMWYYDTLDALVEFLTAQHAAGAPVTFYYTLTTPVETALTDAEIQAYLDLCSYKPTTTVLNDAGAHMVLEYAADPKTYIDNKLAALIAANS